MAKKGYHSLYKKSKSSSRGTSQVKRAAKKATKKQTARAESTFRKQPKAQRQPRMTKEERRKQVVSYKHSMEAGFRPLQAIIFGIEDPQAQKAEAFGREIKKERKAEKKRRTKASGGTRQSQKRKQGDY
mgnify:CR=1 FL=1